MAWYTATARISIGVSVEFDMEDDASDQEVSAKAAQLIHAEVNEVMGGADFIDEDLSPICIECTDNGDCDAIDC